MQYLKLGMHIFPLQERFEAKGQLSAFIDFDYKETSTDSFPPKKPQMPQHQYDLICKKLKEKYSKLSSYFGPNSKVNLALPPKIKNTLLENMVQKIYTPDIFTRAYNYFAKTLEMEIWEPYNNSYSQIPAKINSEEGYNVLIRTSSKI